MLRRTFMQGVASAALMLSQAKANFAIFQTSSSAVAQSWQPLRIGAGGWVHDIDIASDGRMVCQTDTYGAYLWNPATPEPGPGTGIGMWEQQCTPSKLPAITGVTDLFNIQEWVAAQGSWGIRVAPSNTSIIYMCYVGYIFKSTNKGASYSNTNFTRSTVSNMNPNNLTVASMGRHMEIDPINPNYVYVGNMQGLWKTQDGGTNWTLDSTIPGNSTGGVIVAIDPRASTQSGGVSQVIYASSYGTGVYISTNAGASWTLLNGTNSPTTHNRMIVGPATGQLFITDNNSSATTNLHIYSGTNASGTWTNPTISVNSGSRFLSIAIDPTVASDQRIILADGQALLTQSLNGGSTWDCAENDGVFPTQTATDIPYLAQVGGAFGLSNGNQIFDSNGLLWMAEGVGVRHGNPPKATFTSGNNFAWISQSAGIEQLVTNQIIGVPGGSPIAGCWDRAFFTILNPKVYRSTYQPPNILTTAPGGTSCDFAKSNPSYIFAASVGGNLNISPDGGVTWSQKSMPTIANGAGTIAASTPTNLVWQETSGQPYYSTDGGTTWNALGAYFQTNFGITSGTGGSQWNVVADGATAGTFYIVLNGSVYVTTNGGAAWSLVATTPFSGAGTAPILRSVYGQAGHLFYTLGQNFNNNHPQPYGLMRSTNGGVTWTSANANISEPWLVGIGKQEATGTYPSIFFWGWYNGVPGIWKSKDNCVTFTQIGTFQMEGTFDQNVNWIDGDWNQDGACYVAKSGSGVSYYGT